MTGYEYQHLAARTINHNLNSIGMSDHALHGMSAEVGEIHGIFQKFYQGHDVSWEHVVKELGDLLWFVAEFCTAHEWNMDDIMELNIEKLKARYPDGFDSARSINREQGDI